MARFVRPLFLAALLSLTACSHTAPREVTIAGNRIDSAKIRMATVVLMPQSISFYVPLNESTLRSMGCRFVSDQKKDLDALADILATSSIRVAQSNEGDFEPRIGVFLLLDDDVDSMEVRLLMNQDFVDQENLRGHVSVPQQSNMAAVDVPRAVVPRLHDWALTAKYVDQGPITRRDCESRSAFLR